MNKDSPFVEEKVLREMYIEKEMPMHEIAKYLNIAIGTVYNYLRKYSIPTRDQKSTFTMKGRKLTAEQCKQISQRHKGKKLTDEQKRKLAEAHKLKNVPGHTKIRSDGYVAVYFPDHPESTSDGYVMEHRLVMEKVLNRYLEPYEIVHHVNKNRKDNRPENLMLFTSLRDHRMYHHYFNKTEVLKNAQ